MSDKKITEAQYEAQVRAAIEHAFPWLPADKITHQDSFSFKFGHANVTVDSKPKDQARAYADILIHFGGEPLAVFELKRPGKKLTKDDENQGLSYARVLHPRPPLVVVSNSKDVRILETETGTFWKPAKKSEATLKALIERGVQGAQTDLKRAISTLMGTSPNIWMQAVQQITSSTINELSGDWDDPLKPFVKELLLPRKLTLDVIDHLEQAKKLITVEGEPLVGKSNILRELIELTSENPKFVVLYLNADNDVNLFEKISLILSDSLDWPITPDEARQWLVNVSRMTDSTLVLAIDNIGTNCDIIRRDIETLTSNHIGKGLRVVVAMDDTVAEQISKSHNGRAVSTFASRAKRLTVMPLDNEEFNRAQVVLGNLRLSFANGGKYSDELRQPWIIRTITADIVTSPKYQNKEIMAVLSPVPGLEILNYARRRFDVSHLPFSRYKELAKAIIEDLQDTTRPYQLKLELLNTFIVRRDIALHHLSSQELQDMTDIGLVRETRSESGENVYSIRLPELMASELSNLIASELKSVKSNPESAVDWLVKTSSNLPLGNVIAAEAIYHAGTQDDLNFDIIKELLKRAPKLQPISPGTKFATYFKGVGIVDMKLLDDRSISVEMQGKQGKIELDPDDIPSVYDNINPYMILSYLAGHVIVSCHNDGDTVQRLDPILLGKIGSASAPLHHINNSALKNEVHYHDLDCGLFIPCYKNGIVEPITWSLMQFFQRDSQDMVNEFINKAICTNNPSLLSRIYAALCETQNSADNLYSSWAKEIRVRHLKPALDKAFISNIHN